MFSFNSAPYYLFQANQPQRGGRGGGRGGWGGPGGSRTKVAEGHKLVEGKLVSSHPNTVSSPPPANLAELMVSFAFHPTRHFFIHPVASPP